MADKVLCRYFMHNACTKGDACPFSHTKTDSPSDICTFYLRGCCSYGSRCRYKHVAARKLAEREGWGPGVAASNGPRPPPPVAPVAGPPQAILVSSAPGTGFYQHGISQGGVLAGPDGMVNGHPVSADVVYYPPPVPYAAAAAAGPPAGMVMMHHHPGGANGHHPRPMAMMPPGEVFDEFNLPEELWEDFAAISMYPPAGAGELQEGQNYPRGYSPGPQGEQAAKEEDERPEAELAPEERPICSFAAAGECPNEREGGTCPQLHGDRCPTCGKRCLHPLRPEERKLHAETCKRKEDRLGQLKRSQEVECSICLERVLLKPRVAERKFGILSGCEHPFCIACIRGWRSGEHSTQGMDIDGVVRACPVCRVQSHYVTPSVVWYKDAAEKEEIIEGYKRKLGAIDCKHFDYGDGTCPFGISCFYRHAYRDGTLQAVALRHLGTADGSVKIAGPVRLSDFLDFDNLSKKGRRAQ